MPDGYATEVIVPHTEQYAWKYSRYDVLFGIYHQDNLKNVTWQKRGTAVSDLSNHGTTSSDVKTAKAKIFGFLAVKSILAENQRAYNSYKMRWDCVKFTIGIC